MQYEHHETTFALINSNFIKLQLELGIFFSWKELQKEEEAELAWS